MHFFMHQHDYVHYSVPEPPVIETEDENSTNSSALSHSTEALTDAPSTEEAAPPKPPLPGLKVPEHW